MKKTTIISWLIVCALLLVGCNSQYSPASTETSPTEPLPTGSATGDAEPFIPSFMQGTQKPTETTPPQPQPEITWDQSKYKVILSNKILDSTDIEVYPFFCKDSNHKTDLPQTLSKEETVEFMGENYSGNYFTTVCMNFCSSKYYYYEGENYSFCIDENRKLISFRLRGGITPSNESISINEAISRSREYLGVIVGDSIDLAEYQIASTYEYSTIEGDPLYHISFRRSIKGLTVEYVYVEIDQNGELYSFNTTTYVHHDIDMSRIDVDEIISVFDQAKEYVNDLTRKNYTTPPHLSLLECNDGGLMVFGTISLNYPTGAIIVLGIKLLNSQ